MSEPRDTEPPSPPPPEEPGKAPPEAPLGGPTVFAGISERLGGVAVPFAATLLAFAIGGLVVVITGGNPFTAYRAIFEGTGFNYVFPWLDDADRSRAARNLQQTLLVATPLMLTGLAVAFAFRCGLFNIGGQGQYWIGFIAALWIGTNIDGLSRPLHVFVGILAGIVAGAVWGGIAGILRATVGAHEVITTIMLNWIAIFGGSYLFELGGPLQGAVAALPRSEVVAESARLWPIWGGNIQPLHAGIFVAFLGLFVYYIVLNRTTLGFEVRAVGFNPEAARYSGIPVRRSYFLALAISGAFAGTAGAVDVLGFKFAVDTSNCAFSTVGFTGIAVALLGRNKPVGVLLAALLFASLQVGTSSRQLDPRVFDPALATDLATMIQALVIFFVGAELLILTIWGARRRMGFGHRARESVS
ncbi:MAG TPA: ABC transporter permease [Gaiellaceae bacterium]|nr:ABC transporter permease [Gaiellaceae bacterium]